MKLYVGADPGINGAIAFIPAIGDPWVVKMPESMTDLLEALQFANQDCYEPVGLLEKVHSSPQMGVTSSFTFGQGFGKLEMAFTAAKIPFGYITPQKWQKELQCLSKGQKNVTKIRAQQLFPHVKMTHAISDAFLIAEYCRRTTV